MRLIFQKITLRKEKEREREKAGIEGTGRKEGGEGTEKTMVATLVFILTTFLEILYFLKKKKKNWRNGHEDFLSFKNLAREQTEVFKNSSVE